MIKLKIKNVKEINTFNKITEKNFKTNTINYEDKRKNYNEQKDINYSEGSNKGKNIYYQIELVNINWMDLKLKMNS